jgi:hypothetical protein
MTKGVPDLLSVLAIISLSYRSTLPLVRLIFSSDSFCFEGRCRLALFLTFFELLTRVARDFLFAFLEKEEASLLRLERAARVLLFSLFLVVEEEESFLAMGIQLVKNYQKSFSFFSTADREALHIFAIS